MENLKTFIKNNKNMTSLKESFMEACANNEFKKYVDKLPANEDLLIQYTSRLEDAFREYKNYKENPYTALNEMYGYVLTPFVEDDRIRFDYVKTKEKEAEETLDAHLGNIRLFDIGEDIKNASLKKVYTDDYSRVPIIKYFNDFLKKYGKEDVKGLYLTGSFGSGKTYLISALFNELAKKGTKVAIVYYPEFLRSLKSSFETDYNDKFEYIQKVPVLLLDDIGAENVTTWSRDEVLNSILQHRMENHLPTFFTSNLTIKELESSLSMGGSSGGTIKAKRIIERINFLANTLELISKNRRN